MRDGRRLRRGLLDRTFEPSLSECEMSRLIGIILSLKALIEFDSEAAELQGRRGG